MRFLYNKSTDETGTNLQLVGYRYSTRGYYNFADTTYRRMSGYSVETRDGVIQVKPKFTDYYNLAYSKRGKVQLSVTQQLGRTATLYLSGSHQTYWGTDDADEQLQAGLNAAVDDINWSLSYSLTKTPGSRGAIKCWRSISISPSATGCVPTAARSGGTPAPATACRTISMAA